MKNTTIAGAVMLLSVGCAYCGADPSQPAVNKHDTPVAKTPLPAQTSTAVAPRSATPDAPNAGTGIQRRYCPAAAGTGSAGAGAADSTWLANATMQSSVQVLDQELRPHESELIGVHFDDARKTAVVVFHMDVQGLDSLEAQIAERVAPLRVELRHGCYARDHIQAALAVLEARAWHPKAKATPIGWHLEPSFSGYTVIVDEAAPEVAEALRTQLGAIVRVTLGKPRRYGNP
jgi:aromatic ring-cleaving dioxygenase